MIQTDYTQQRLNQGWGGKVSITSIATGKSIDVINTGLGWVNGLVWYNNSSFAVIGGSEERSGVSQTYYEVLSGIPKTRIGRKYRVGPPNLLPRTVYPIIYRNDIVTILNSQTNPRVAFAYTIHLNSNKSSLLTELIEPGGRDVGENWTLAKLNGYDAAYFGDNTVFLLGHLQHNSTTSYSFDGNVASIEQDPLHSRVAYVLLQKYQPGTHVTSYESTNLVLEMIDEYNGQDINEQPVISTVSPYRFPYFYFTMAIDDQYKSIYIAVPGFAGGGVNPIDIWDIPLWRNLNAVPGENTQLAISTGSSGGMSLFPLNAVAPAHSKC